MEPGPLARIIGVPLAAFFVALTIRSIFAFLETSITALSLFKLKELAQSTKKYAQLFKTLEENPHKVLITILIVSSCTDVTTAAIGTYVMENIAERLQLSEGFGFSLGIGIATIAIIIFGEIIPKNFAKSHSTKRLQSALWIINSVFFMLNPIVSFIVKVARRVGSLVGQKEILEDHNISSEHEVKFLINYMQSHGVMDKEKSSMLHNIFDLGNTPVREIMIPETDIISLDVNASTEHALKLFSLYHFTRLPVYQESPNNIIGLIHLKDIFIMIFQQQTHKALNAFVRRIVFIPESVKINQLLKDFREQNLHMAIVLNEHGSTVGLITLEDVLEQIVGDIKDEHEIKNSKIIEMSDQRWLVDASVDLNLIQTFLNIKIETDNAVTLGGFIVEQLQHLPKKGESLSYQHHSFQIHHASNKKINKVIITKEAQSP